MIDTSNVSASVGRPFLGKAVRSIRIISAEKRVSSNKNDMLTLELEICAPDTEKASDGSTIKVAGLSFRDQITFHGKNNIPLEQLKALVVACKASPKVDLDDAAFLKNSFVGKGIRAEVRTEPKPLTQVDDSGNVAPVLDDSGNPVVDNNYRLGRVIGGDDRYTISADAVQ
jgi:hypothetical protein